MTDVDPKIWENPTLGAVGAGPFLDEVEAQAREDYNARREGREPLIAYHRDRYPKYAELNVSSTVSTYTMLRPEEVPVEGEVIIPPVEDSPAVEASEFSVEEDSDPTDANFDDFLKQVNSDDDSTK